MRIVSTRYRTINRLKSFIQTKVLDDENDIFVQLFLPANSKEKILNTLIETLNHTFDKDKIFGIYTEGSLINSVYVDDIVINFIIVKKESAKLIYHKNLYECKDFDKSFFHIVNSIDIDKHKFLKEVSKDMDLVATFYNKMFYFDGEIYTSGSLLFMIKKDFEPDIRIVKSIEPIGRELKVTNAEDNYINSVENLSLKELYKHYLTESKSKDLQKASYTFPILKIKENGFESSLIINSDCDDKIKVEFEVKTGDILKIGYANTSNFYKKYDEALKYFHNKYSDTFFVISSTAKRDFFKENGFDFESAVGFFSQSEAVIFQNKCYDLSHSVILVNINSSGANKLKKQRYKKAKAVIKEYDILDALANIAKVSSDELEKLNKKLEKKVKIEVEKNLKKDSILIHRSRLAQMGEMMSLIAHQWKQPLSAISATSSGLHIKIELDMYDKEFFLNSLTKIEELVNHLSTTIDDFSNFFKPSKIKKEFYLYEAVNKALSIATYSLSKKSIDLVLDLDKSLRVKTFQNELIQVLLNIIKNAENILIKREIENPKIYIRLFEKDGKKIIEIEDNAGGIDKKIISKIFEPYFSTKATKDSTGLGLYMSRFIVEDSLGGELKVRNSENGAVFSIILV